VNTWFADVSGQNRIPDADKAEAHHYAISAGVAGEEN
jgi:hypothetical protein